MIGSLLVPCGTQPVGFAVVGLPGQGPQPPPGQGAEFGKASPIALVVIVLLALATILLIRSMTKHLRRVPASFDPAPDDPAPHHPAPHDPAPHDPAPGDSAPREPVPPDDGAPQDDGPAAGHHAPSGRVAATDVTGREQDTRREH